MWENSMNHFLEAKKKEKKKHDLLQHASHIAKEQRTVCHLHPHHITVFYKETNIAYKLMLLW